MTNMDPRLSNRLKQKPQETVRLIVRVQGELAPAAERAIALNAKVLRRLRLINALVISSSAETALALLREPWALSAEEDGRVFAQQSRSAEGSHNDRR